MESRTDVRSVSVVIPTYNGAARIGSCLDALLHQVPLRNLEILVVDDGSTDNTSDVVRQFPGVRLVIQTNAGPAAARNRGAMEAHGEILLFTDDDCVPASDWLQFMLGPFHDPEVVGVKGVYRTRQRSLIARFVQIEYEDRYHLMSSLSVIDFVDTYSAGFRRDRFMEMTGYDTSFPVACAEDIELSYRMSARAWKMKFVPGAVVYHTHPDSFSKYLKKKYKFAFWRVLALRKNPRKAVKDSHTPQVMKFQVLLVPSLLLGFVLDLTVHPRVSAVAVVAVTFFFSTIPFAVRAIRKDSLVGLLSPIFLAARACAQVLGIAGGLAFTRHRAVSVISNSTI